MAKKWIKTGYKGVRYREHPERKFRGKPDRYFVIYYRRDGKLKEEALGWASEWQGGGILTPKKASEIREELQTAYRLGKDASTLEERRRQEKERKKKEDLNKKQNSTIEYFFEKIYLPHSKSNKAERSWKREEQLFKAYIKSVIGSKSFSQVSPVDLENLKKTMIDIGRSPRTIQYTLAVVRQIFNYAKMLNYFQGDNPVSKVKKPTVDNRRLRFLTRDEANRLLAELKKRSQQLHDIALLSLHCGLRAGEIFNLTWDCINFETEQILIKDPKNKSNRYAYMTTKVKEMLERRYQQGQLNGHIFTNRKGEKLKDIPRSFAKAVQDIGLYDDIEDKRQRVVFHTLRHTYASWLVEQGVDLYTVKELMGHKTLAMTERYSHLGENTLKQAVSRLDESL
jgi:integrase